MTLPWWIPSSGTGVHCGSIQLLFQGHVWDKEEEKQIEKVNFGFLCNWAGKLCMSLSLQHHYSVWYDARSGILQDGFSIQGTMKGIIQASNTLVTAQCFCPTSHLLQAVPNLIWLRLFVELRVLVVIAPFNQCKYISKYIYIYGVYTLFITWLQIEYIYIQYITMWWYMMFMYEEMQHMFPLTSSQKETCKILWHLIKKWID